MIEQASVAQDASSSDPLGDPDLDAQGEEVDEGDMDVDAEGEIDHQHHQQQQPPSGPQDSDPGDMEMQRRHQEMFTRNWEALTEARGQAEDYVKELQRHESL